MYRYHSIKTVFSITNVCNFNCESCNSFQNYHLSGIQKWADHSEIYRKWSEILDVGLWELSGGEIMTSPDWVDWVIGIHQLWPNNPGQILTNGSLIQRNKDKMQKLYKVMAESGGKIKLVISLHNIDRIDEIVQTVKDFLGPTWRPHTEIEFEKNFINSYNAIRAESWPLIEKISEWHQLPKRTQTECKLKNLNPDTEADLQLNSFLQIVKSCKDQDIGIFMENKDKVQVSISTEQMFYDPAARYDVNTGMFNLHNSNPDIAHDACQEKCLQKGKSPGVFYYGKIHKCATSKVLRDLDDQYKLNITDSDRSIIQGYRAGSLDMSNDDLDNWFANWHNKIDNCKFCPENYDNRQLIAAGTKKIFIKKKSKK